MKVMCLNTEVQPADRNRQSKQNALKHISTAKFIYNQNNLKNAIITLKLAA